jgi:hypothetical protein
VVAALPEARRQGDARKAFTRIVKSNSSTVEELDLGAMRYAAERTGQNPKFTKHPATWLNGRIDELGKAEVACDVDLTMAVVVDLLEPYPSAKLSDDQARRKAKGYMTALEDVPPWAVAETGRRWLKARAGPQKYDFAPTPSRLRQIADDVLSDVRAQRHLLQRLSRAKSVSEEKRIPRRGSESNRATPNCSRSSRQKSPRRD